MNYVEIKLKSITTPKIIHNKESMSFWFVKDEFCRIGYELCGVGQIFSSWGYRRDMKTGFLHNDGDNISKQEIAYMFARMRMLYMNKEPVSIMAISNYLIQNINSKETSKFMRFIQCSWIEALTKESDLNGALNIEMSNNELMRTIFYSRLFHVSERYSNKLDNILKKMDESLLLKIAYNAIHPTFHVYQIYKAIEGLTEDNLIVKLPLHLKQHWS